MDPIEKAIRTAFAKGDPDDRVFREKVYRSAFGALDRAIQASPNMTEAIAARRRETLLAAITAIETEFVPARPASPEPPRQAAPDVVAPDVAAPEGVAPVHVGREEPAFAPSLDGERRPAAARRRDGGGKGDRRAAGRDAGAQHHDRRRPRRRWRAAGLLVLLLVVLAAAAWWFAGPGSVLQQPRTGEEAAPRIPGAGETMEDWVDIFTPADPTTVAAPGDSQAEVMEDDSGRFIRIRSGASGSPVLFDIGQGVLEQVAGRRAVFSVVARAPEGEGTQISVDCSLGELGDCGRKRYVVGASREEFLFEVDLPATRPGSGGTIAINPAIEGGGRSADIYAIRVLPAQ